MSAFVVDKPHIDALVDVAINGPSETPRQEWRYGIYYGNPTRKVDDATADALGQMLVNECVRSVRYRYKGDGDNELPGPIDPYWQTPYSWSPFIAMNRKRPTAVQTLKLIRCYEYQSCEHPDWKASDAASFCEALRDHCIAFLPGYHDAPWEWTGVAS